MSRSVDREVECSLREAESRRSCLTAHSEIAHRILERRRASGELIMPEKGLYVRKELWDGLTRSERYLYKVRGFSRIYPNWTFCGLTAAMLHGLSVSYRLLDRIQIASPSGPRIYRSGLVQCMRLVDPPTTYRDGISFTDPRETVFDCARWLEFPDAVAVTDSALRLGLTSKEDLADFFATKKRHRGIQAAREVLDFADGASGSGGESIARAVMWQLGYAAPSLQREVRDPLDNRPYYVDFCWELPGGGLVFGEHDGRQKYVDRQMNGGSALEALRRERLRESRLSSCCDAIVRFTPEDVADVKKLDALLGSFGIPKDHKPTIELAETSMPSASPRPIEVREEVPLDAYWY